MIISLGLVIKTAPAGRTKEIMQFNDAFAQVIRVKSNAAAIKQLKRNLSRDLIPRFLSLARVSTDALACHYLRFTISLAVQFIRCKKHLADIWSNYNIAPDKTE